MRTTCSPAFAMIVIWASLVGQADAGLVGFTLTFEAGPVGGAPANVQTLTDTFQTSSVVSYLATTPGDGGGQFETGGGSAFSSATGYVGDMVTNDIGTYLRPNIHLYAEAHGDVTGNAEFPSGGAQATATMTYIDELIFYPFLNPIGTLLARHELLISGSIESFGVEKPYLEVSVADEPAERYPNPLSPFNFVFETETYAPKFDPREAGGWRSLLKIQVKAHAEISAPGSALAKFDNTIQIGNFQFFDQDGNPIYGRLESALGVDYTMAQPQAVPEPGTLTLAGLGTAGLIAGALRRPRFTRGAQCVD